jgi:thiamine biosynthesis lipoprotein
VGCRNHARARAAIDRALGWFEAVEACCSRFDPSSELQRLCARPHEPVAVSDLLFHAVQFAVGVAARTDGAFDPAIGRAMLDAGYDRHHRTAARVPHEGERGSWRDVYCDSATRTITLHRAVQLDLGAVAKGMAIDLAARELNPLGDFMIDAGGDLFVGGCNEHGQPWRVGIRHPTAEGELLAVIEASDLAICTSATSERGGHLRDGRDGAPAAALLSVSVLAPTAMAADAAGTAVFALGPARGRAWLDAEGLSALLMQPDGAMVAVGAWPNVERTNDTGSQPRIESGADWALGHEPAHDTTAVPRRDPEPGVVRPT